MGRKAFATLFLCFLGLALYFGIYNYYKSFQHDECKNVFESGIYKNYQKQIQHFLVKHSLFNKAFYASSSEFNNMMQQFLRDQAGELSPTRSAHETFIQKLRALAHYRLAKNPLPHEVLSYQLLDEFILWLFLEVDLKTSLSTYLYTFVSYDTQDPHEFYQVLRAFPLFSGMQLPPKKEDGFLHGNLPSHMFNLPRTKVVRFAYPFSESNLPLATPTPHPEFLLFLHLQPKHFYVNLMKRQGVEAQASKALENLEKKYPYLYIITLDKNSLFYWQNEKKYPATMSASDFEKDFLQQLTAKEGAFFWSHHLDPTQWEKELKTLITKVYQNHFYPKTDLSRSERQAWIELTYLDILDHLVEKWEPQSMNLTCKGGMDRGPSLTALWMWKKQTFESQEINTWLFSPPLLFHNRGSHRSRIDRFDTSLKHLNSYIHKN